MSDNVQVTCLFKKRKKVRDAVEAATATHRAFFRTDRHTVWHRNKARVHSIALILHDFKRGVSSIGRASDSSPEGWEFESLTPQASFLDFYSFFLLFCIGWWYWVRMNLHSI